jgi:sulfate adenylyltransferase subunit 1 (EFTu-like GTPase family)
MSGTLAVGQTVRVLPSGLASSVASLYAGGAPITEARAGQSVVVCLADDLDVGRGDLLVGDGPVPPRVTSELRADVAWMSRSAAAVETPYILKSGTREVRARIQEVETRYDLASGRALADDRPTMSLNELGRVRLKTSAPIAVDAYRDARATGSFLLVDPTTSETLAAGMIA